MSDARERAARYRAGAAGEEESEQPALPEDPLERAAFVDAFRTDDSVTGVASFLEHGPGKATFTGR